MDCADVVEVSKALLTPLIALIALWIAFQQLSTNKQKLKLELYDRRLAIFEKTTSIIGSVTTHMRIEPYESVAFIRDVSEAKFLFGPEIPKYLQELFEHCVDLSIATDQLKDETIGVLTNEERKEYREQKRRAAKWIITQHEQLNQIFSPYLQFPK